MANIEDVNTNFSDKETESNDRSGSNNVEKKLGDLLMRGWRMLAESCPKECKLLIIL